MTTDKPWLQVRGDPSVRQTVFLQERVESLFDTRLMELHAVVQQLLCMRGVFHAKIHYSSNQLTCWLYNDPYRYRVYVGEEIFADGFLDQFEQVMPAYAPVIPAWDVGNILDVFRRLRFQDEQLYLRNASINIINGLIGVTFSCDGSHYIRYHAFHETVKLLWIRGGRAPG